MSDNEHSCDTALLSKTVWRCGTTENCFCHKRCCVAKCLVVGGLAKNQSLRFSKSFLPIPGASILFLPWGERDWENRWGFFIIKSFLPNLSQMCRMKQGRRKMKNRWFDCLWFFAFSRKQKSAVSQIFPWIKIFRCSWFFLLTLLNGLEENHLERKVWKPFGFHYKYQARLGCISLVGYARACPW